MNVHLVLAAYAGANANVSTLVFSVPYPIHVSQLTTTQTVLMALNYLS